MPKLTKRFVDTVKTPGFYGDGEGLYLSVKPSGSKSWILRTVVQGKRRDLGIGSASMVLLSTARDQAREMRKVAREGGDPIATNKIREITFEEAAREYHSIVSKSFSSGKHTQLWLSGLSIYAFPKIGSRSLENISVTDVRLVLEPIWNDKHETARRIKQRMEAIFDWAKAEGHYSGDNPCIGVKRILKPQRRNPIHHAALPWNEVPHFYSLLIERDGTSAFALRLAILTACRSREIREASWGEINGSVWTVPASRTKTQKSHRVPLSQEAQRVIAQVKGLDDQYLFPSRLYGGGKGSRPLSVNAFRSLYARMNVTGFTTHGFRSTFRDWCSEYEQASREVAEASLAHSLGSVERAYRRSDLFDHRVKLMTSWSKFVTSSS